MVRIKAELVAGRYRFGLLTRITLADGEDIDLWSARDALVLKALTIVLAKHLPISSPRQQSRSSSNVPPGFMSRIGRSR